MPTSKEFEVSGTPQYMAPEQFTAAVHHLGPWTDLYAVGCLAVHPDNGPCPLRKSQPDRILQRSLQRRPSFAFDGRDGGAGRSGGVDSSAHGTGSRGSISACRRRDLGPSQHLERLQLDISWQRLETTVVPGRAREFLQRALDGNRPQIVAHAREIVARIDRRESRTAQAYSGFEAALSYFKANGLRLETARCLEGMAWTAVQAGDIADAQRHYQEVLRLLPDPGFQAIKIVCDSLNGLAEIARRKGDHQRALHWLDRGQVFAEEAGNTRVMADILNSRGEIHREAGQFDLAESYYQQTLDIFLELGGVDIRVGQTNLTLVYLGRREYARALDVATEILAELDCSVATFHCSILEVIIATSLAGLGRFDEAKEHLDRGITLTESIVHVEPDTASILETLAILAAEHHQFELARQALKKR